MNTSINHLLIVLLVVVTVPAIAVETSRTQSGAPTSSATQLEATERSRANEWGLSLDEFHRSQSLLRGFTGSVADTRITPIEVLGIHAKDDTERDRYAEKFARFMFDYVDRAMKFEVAYQRAARRLFPTIPVHAIDTNQSMRPTLQEVLQRTPGIEARNVAHSVTPIRASTVAVPASGTQRSGDRLILFTGPDCAQCLHTLQRAQAHARQGTAIDVYVVGVTSDAQLIQYARKIKLDSHLIEQGVLTLNRDQGTMSKVIPDTQRLPQLLRKRGDAITLLDAGQL